jgi:8-oxo-dGTP diphosphatase
VAIQQNIKVAVDAVVFGYEAGLLKVLLIRRKRAPQKTSWALPGGFVLDHENLEEALHRELREETNVSINYYEQLYTYGDPKRDRRFRVVSVAYYALVRPDQFELAASTDADEAAWFEISCLPKLEFDHSRIVADALERLRGKLVYEPIGFDLLEKTFPFADLEALYSIVLGQAIDRRNFRKKILGLGFLDEVKQQSTGERGRPAMLYKFNKSKYFQLKKKGFHGDFW